MVTIRFTEKFLIYDTKLCSHRKKIVQLISVYLHQEILTRLKNHEICLKRRMIISGDIAFIINELFIKIKFVLKRFSLEIFRKVILLMKRPEKSNI